MVDNKSMKGNIIHGAVEHWLQLSDADKIERRVREWNRAQEIEKPK